MEMEIVCVYLLHFLIFAYQFQVKTNSLLYIFNWLRFLVKWNQQSHVKVTNDILFEIELF